MASGPPPTWPGSSVGGAGGGPGMTCVPGSNRPPPAGAGPGSGWGPMGGAGCGSSGPGSGTGPGGAGWGWNGSEAPGVGGCHACSGPPGDGDHDCWGGAGAPGSGCHWPGAAGAFGSHAGGGGWGHWPPGSGGGGAGCCGAGCCGHWPGAGCGCGGRCWRRLRLRLRGGLGPLAGGVGLRRRAPLACRRTAGRGRTGAGGLLAPEEAQHGAGAHGGEAQEHDQHPQAQLDVGVEVAAAGGDDADEEAEPQEDGEGGGHHLELQDGEPADLLVTHPGEGAGQRQSRGDQGEEREERPHAEQAGEEVQGPHRPSGVLTEGFDLVDPDEGPEQGEERTRGGDEGAEIERRGGRRRGTGGRLGGLGPGHEWVPPVTGSPPV